MKSEHEQAVERERELVARDIERQTAKRQMLDDELAKGRAAIEVTTQNKRRLRELYDETVGQRSGLQSEAMGKVLQAKGVTKEVADLVQLDQLIAVYAKALAHLDAELARMTDQTERYRVARDSMGG